MKIYFFNSHQINLVSAIDEEGVGFDPDWPTSGGGKCRLLKDKYDHPVWETAVSQYTYTLLGSGPTTFRRKDSKGGCIEIPEGQHLWMYDGAESGYLAQNLLPPELKEGGIILAVEGTYGKFEGDKVLEEYAAIKRWWEEKCLSIFNQCEGTLFNSNGHAFGSFCASMWKLRFFVPGLEQPSL